MRFVTTLLLVLLVSAVNGGGLAMAKASLNGAKTVAVTMSDADMVAPAYLAVSQRDAVMIAAADTVRTDALVVRNGPAPCSADCPWLPAITDHDLQGSLTDQASLCVLGFCEPADHTQPRPPRA